MAVIFAIILIVAGIWSSRKRPWKGGEWRMAVVKAFATSSMPFVVADAATGFISLAAEQLSIPPAIGLGTGVDIAILWAGLAVPTAAVLKARESES